MSFTATYFEEQKKYSNIYGPKTIVFMQNGKFYDSYCSEKEGYVNLAELEPLLNIKFIRRDGSNKKGSKMPNQFGIPCVSMSRNLTTLIENGYTIVVFDQKKTSTSDEIERECIGVFSPGTYISDRQSSDANYILGVYIVEEKQLSGQKTLMAVGVTFVDITTGNIMNHEFYSDKYDERFGLDELVRMMQIFRPTEIIIYYHPVEIDENTVTNIKTYLELKKFANCQFYIYHNKKGDDQLNLLSQETFKINYQNDYLASIFDLNNQLTLNKKQSAIEVLGLERKPYSIISLSIILRYIAEHNTSLLKNLSWPTVYIYNKHLILGNNAIEQLNIIDSNNLELYNYKIKSLFDVINRTSTPMGRRLLKENLLNPLSQENKQLILQRYDLIETLIKGNLYKKVQIELKNIHDMERLHRRMGMGMIVPYEFYRLDLFYQATTKIINLIKDNKPLRGIITEQTIKDFLSLQINYNKEYDFDKLQNYNTFSEIDQSFFKKNVHSAIDKIQEKIDYVWSLINSINTYFTNLISDRCKKIYGKDLIEIKHNDMEGYFFTISKSREKILKEEISKKGKIKIDLTIGETLEIKKNDIIFKGLKKGRTKIFVTPLVEHTLNLTEQTTKLTKLIKKKFINSMLDHYNKNKILLHKIKNFVSEMDFLVSGAIVATEYYYCKPQIPSEKNIGSYLKTKKLRHAIIEKLCAETEFIPNDIELGNVPEDEGIERCLDPETPVMMINGDIIKAKNIKIGDILMGDDSKPRTVLKICKGVSDMYQIVPKKGDPFIVNGKHILCLKSSGYKSVTWGGNKEQRYRAVWMENHKYRTKSFGVKVYDSKKNAYNAAKTFLKSLPSDRGKIIEISVEDYLKKPSQWRINYYLYRVGTEFEEQPVKLDPYILGHWLGDGTSRTTEITTADKEIVNYYKKYFDSTGVVVNYKGEYQYSITTGINVGGKNRNWFMNVLRDYDLINNKHIPIDYLVNSREIRMAVLAGLVDSDGSNCHDRYIEIIQKNEKLADNIVYLVRSLGFWCEKKKCTKTCTNSKNGPVKGTYYRVNICGSDFSKLPLLLEYKRPHAENKTARFDSLISSFKVKKLGKGNYCGFELDKNHRFLLSDYTVTHNSGSNKKSTIKNAIEEHREKNQDKNGILIYGINSSGKSSFMKSIGIAIILAQIGYYVPAEEFVYEPYMALYARITGNDNIFKGLSSFALEMTELDAILLRTEKQGPYTLIIGDEVCRGTENTSGISIVASTLMTLSECGATFIFSSHLHDLPNIEEIKNLKNLRQFHLRVEYDESNDCLVFDRKLTPGSGPSVYGLMVARYLIKNTKFIQRAETIKKRLLKEENIILPIKKSNYNKDLIVKSCAICNYYPTKDYHKELESHHIYFQKDCLADGKIKEKPYLSKNRLYNLVVLCRKCHLRVHRGEIDIKGYDDTSIGPLLNYKVNVRKRLENELKEVLKLEGKYSEKNKEINC